MTFSVTFSKKGEYKILFIKLNNVLSRYKALALIYFRLPWEGGADESYDKIIKS